MRCKIACSTPPIYWSTFIQYFTFSLSNTSFSFLGSQYLRKYHEESRNVSIVSISLFAGAPHTGHTVSTNVLLVAIGDSPLPVNSISVGSSTGRFSSFSGTQPQ